MKQMINIFCEVANRLRTTISGRETSDVVRLAIEENVWFSEESIKYAIDSIISGYLQRESIERWVSQYDIKEISNPHNIAVIMAGNIPLVGFFDIMAVLISGNRCMYKPSSKDRALIEHVVSLLKDIEPNILIERLDDSKRVDALIATGGDNAVRLFKSTYGDIPAIYRGSRYSVALLTGDEPVAKLKLLANDIFMHSGLGCRNVSMIFAPRNYNLKHLICLLKSYSAINDKYLNNYRQNIAMMKLDNSDYLDGGFFTMRVANDTSHIISNINIAYYDNIEDLKEWLLNRESELQCVVSEIETIPFQVSIGSAQCPELNDYPDRVDTLKFLLSL